MLFFLGFLCLTVVADDLVTTKYTFALDTSMTYGPTVLPAQTALVLNFTYPSCIGHLQINVTGMVPDDVILIESINPTLDMYQQNLGKPAHLTINDSKPSPYICAIFKATVGSEMNFTLSAERLCYGDENNNGGKGGKSDPKASFNLSILSSISCILLYILVK